MTTKKADYILVQWRDDPMGRGESTCHVPRVCTTGLRYSKVSAATILTKGPVVFRHREHMQRLHDSAKKSTVSRFLRALTS